MKANTHPFLIETKIQHKDGAIYKKRWQFFRGTLPLEIDAMAHPLWQKEAKIHFKNLVKRAKLNKN